MSKPMQGLAAYLRCEAGAAFIGKREVDTLRQWAIEVDQAAHPDCRTCDNFHHTGCMVTLHSEIACTNGDKYQPAPRVVLWRTEP